MVKGIEAVPKNYTFRRPFVYWRGIRAEVNAMNDTRQAILSIAMEHFSTRNYTSVNLEEIALEAHVTRAPLYYYFKNKEGLYRAIVTETLNTARTRMEALLDAKAPIFEVLRREFAYCLDELGKFQHIWNPGPDAPDCEEEVHIFQQWLLDRKKEVLTAAWERGELRRDCDISEIVTFIYVFYEGVLAMRAKANQPTGFNQTRLDNSCDWFLDIVRQRFGSEGE